MLHEGTLRNLPIVAVLVTTATLASCGGGQAATTSAGSTPTSSSTTSAAPPPAGQGVTMHVVLGGGTLAGTYDLKSDKSCSMVSVTVGGQPKKLWSAGFGDDKSTTISGINFVIDVAQTPPLLTFGAFGPISTDTTSTVPQVTYDVSTIAAGYGSGTAEVQDHGSTATMSMKGQTKEGWTVTATAQCNKVDRVG